MYILDVMLEVRIFVTNSMPHVDIIFVLEPVEKTGRYINTTGCHVDTAGCHVNTFV